MGTLIVAACTVCAVKNGKSLHSTALALRFPMTRVTICSIWGQSVKGRVYRASCSSGTKCAAVHDWPYILQTWW